MRMWVTEIGIPGTNEDGQVTERVSQEHVRMFITEAGYHRNT
jgi:hypothetical protein